MTDVVGVDGRDETLVSNKGVADGWERRVIQKANGEGSELNIKSELRVNDSVGWAGRLMTLSGSIVCFPCLKCSHGV
jgi:hypothetical protein